MKNGTAQRLWLMVRDKTAAKLISAVVSLTILCVLYRKLDLGAILKVLSTSSPAWLLISVGMIIPITLANALRFGWVSSNDTNGDRKISYLDAFAMTVVAIAMNLFIVFERLCDAFAISSWCLLAWLSGFGGEKLDPVVVPAIGIWFISATFLLTGNLASKLLTKLQTFRLFRGREKLQSLANGWPDLHRCLGTRGKWIILFSVGLWLLHLTQIWMFTVAVRASVPFTAGLALSPVVLLCGLVPFTLGGIGPRDAATIYLFAAYMAPEPAAAVGLLMISRSILPALAAIPFVRRYLNVILPEPSNPEANH